MLSFERPGDYLKPGEDEIEGLKRRLDERLAPIEGQYEVDTSGENDWEIGDCLAQWWRPNFETFMVRSWLHSRDEFLPQVENYFSLYSMR